MVGTEKEPKASFVEIELRPMPIRSGSYVRRKYKYLQSMTWNTRVKCFLELVVTIFSLSGLIIYTMMLCDQYFKGRTVVNVRVETLRVNHNPPGITICYPELLSMEKMANNFADLKPAYDNYLKVVAKATEQDYKKSEFTDGLNKMYDSFYRYRYEHHQVTIKDIFDMSVPLDTIPAKDESTGEITNEPVIEVEIGGNHFYENGTSQLIEHIVDRQPIETIALKTKDYEFKCFTFFSHLNKTWRDLKMDLSEVNIKIRHNEKHFPVSKLFDQTLEFAMHSANTIPQFVGSNYFRPIRFNKEIQMSFSRLKTILLPPPYKTNCRTYDMAEDHEFKFRSDCINWCAHDRVNRCMRETCSGSGSGSVRRSGTDSRSNYTHKSSCVFPTNALLTRHLISKQYGVKPCRNVITPKILNHNYNVKLAMRKCLNKKINEYDLLCERSCQPECENRYYNYDIKSERDSTGLTSIKIVHDQFPDQKTEHIPEMTGIQFIANFGGLVGMWLGLSSLVIGKYLISKVFK